MKKITIFHIVTACILVYACNTEKTPIIFSKITEDSEITLTLDTNNTFTYKARHVKGAAFNESGTYTVQDTVLILNYSNQEYSYNCYTIPLPNDTLLFGLYNNKTILYSLHTQIPGIDSILTHQQVMQRIVNEYNSQNFTKHIGTFIFACTQGNPSQLYKSTYKISKYYDTFIE